MVKTVYCMQRPRKEDNGTIPIWTFACLQGGRLITAGRSSKDAEQIAANHMSHTS